jgi:hypothetical protein
MNSIHEDPALELFTLRLEIAEVRDHRDSLLADVQVYRMMTSEALTMVTRLTAQLDAARRQIEFHKRAAYSLTTGHKPVPRDRERDSQVISGNNLETAAIQ